MQVGEKTHEAFTVIFWGLNFFGLVFVLFLLICSLMWEFFHKKIVPLYSVELCNCQICSLC